MDLISVIVPIYNVEKYLIRCVDSICGQSYSNLEVILVDDGSPDKCGDICEQLKKTDKRIKVIHKENGGLGFARNSGLKEVTGKYVTFIDSDDWISSDHIENLYKVIKKFDADVCIGGNTNVNLKGDTLKKEVKLEKKLYVGSDIIKEIVLPLIAPDTDYKNDIQLESSCCMNLYAVDIIKDNMIEFISERYAVAEDVYFNIDYLVHATRVITSGEIGYFYFDNSESISRKYNPKRFERTINFYTEIDRRIKKYGLENIISHRLDRSYLTKIRVAIRHIVMSDLKLTQKFKEIKTIVGHPLTREVVNRYPIQTYIPAIKWFTIFIKWNWVFAIFCMVSMREFAQNITFLKKLLRRNGIGR